MPGAHRLLIAAIATSLLVAGFAYAAGEDKDSAPVNTASSAVTAPKARVDVVEDTLHGKKIADPYRWLEDSSNPETQQFMKDELAYTHSLLDRQPQKERIHVRLSQLMQIGSVESPAVEGNLYFHTRRDGGQNQPVLYVRQGVNGNDRELVNVNALAADGTVALDWWDASPKGKYLAYGTSPGGSEISMLHVIDVATGKLLAENIDRCRAASIGWLPDSSGFYYTKYPRPGDVAKGQEMYNRHVFFHHIGDNPDGSSDKLIFGEGHDPQEWPNVQVSKDGRWLLITPSHGWTKTELFLKDLKSDSPVTLLTEGKDFLYGAQIHNGIIYIQTNEDAPRFRIFQASLENAARTNWKEMIPQSEAVLSNIHIAGDNLIANYEKDASSHLRLFSLDGGPLGDITLPSLGTVNRVSGDNDSKLAFYHFNSYIVPDAVYSYDVASSRSSEWAKVSAPIDPSRYDVKQVFYPSKDGTKIPMFIVSKKGLKLDGTNPTLLAGYGGFNLSRTPTFWGWLHLWLENGGVFADANLRGGSEYGEDWHRAGMLEKKQNVFDDFITAAEYLIREKYTDTPHLAVYGRSNGGLLTGAVLTQRPDLYRAVVCGVPLLDMLRYHQFQIARLWIPEYGSAEDPKQFDFIYAYSPYHHVKEVQYPAILFFTSDGDTRVDPLHARKMTALMQAKAKNGQSQERPILLRIEPKAGHGAGKPIAKQIDEWTDIFTFLFWQLGVK